MNDRLRGMLMAAAALVVVVSLAVSPVAAQTAEVARDWDGHPDLNGVWQAIGTAHWDIQDHRGERRASRLWRDRRHSTGPGGGGRQRDSLPAVGPGAEAAELRESVHR